MNDEHPLGLTSERLKKVIRILQLLDELLVSEGKPIELYTPDELIEALTRVANDDSLNLDRDSIYRVISVLQYSQSSNPWRRPISPGEN